MEEELRPEDAGYESEEREERRRAASPWAWIALAVILLLVIFLIWSYLQRGGFRKTGTDGKRTPEISIPGAPGEPNLPPPGTATSEGEPTGTIVPGVVGDPEPTAADAIRGAGLEVSVTRVFSATRISGRVIAQNPGGGSRVEPDSSVEIVVSMGSPDVPTVEMPKVRGLSQAEAESRLRAVGLKPYILYGKPLTGVPKGHVMSQWPDAGDSLPQGSEAFIQIVYVP